MPKGPRAPHPTSTHRPAPYPSARPTPTAMASASPINERSTSTPWNHADDLTLMQARHQGLSWAPIATKYFPSKTPNACRKRHERLMEKKNGSENWDPTKIEALAKAYTDVHEKMWRMLAERVGEKWEDVEKKCMEKGFKTLLNLGRTVIRKERNQGSQDSTDPGRHNDALVIEDDSSSSSELGHEELPPQQQPQLPQLPYVGREDQMSPYPGVSSVEDQRHRAYSISREDTRIPYSAGGVSNSTPSYTPTRSFSTASIATIFSPVSATAPQQHSGQPMLPGFRSLANIASMMQSPPPVTTH